MRLTPCIFDPGTSRHRWWLPGVFIAFVTQQERVNHSSPLYEASVAAMAGHGDLQEMLRMLTARKAPMMAAMGYIKALQSKNLKRRDTGGVNSCLLGVVVTNMRDTASNRLPRHLHLLLRRPSVTRSSPRASTRHASHTATRAASVPPRSLPLQLVGKGQSWMCTRGTWITTP